MRPAGEYHIRSCVYHYYGRYRLPPCKGYNYLPVDSNVKYERKEVVIINDYSQYKGRVKWTQ